MVNKVEFPKNKILYFWNIGQHPLVFYKHVVKSRMQENNFCLCLRNPCENTFSKLQIFIFFLKKKECSKYVRVLAVCNTQKHFYIFIETRVSQLNANITIEGSKPSYILQDLQET